MVVFVNDPPSVERRIDFAVFFNCFMVLWQENMPYYFFLSLRAGGILQILQSDWFPEPAVFYDLAR